MKVTQESTELIIKERFFGSPLTIIYIVAVIAGAMTEVEMLPILLDNIVAVVASLLFLFMVLYNLKRVTIINVFSRVVSVRIELLLKLSEKIVNIFSFDGLYLTQSERSETGELRPLAKKSLLILVYNGTEILELGSGKVNMLGHGKFLDQVRLISLYLGLEAQPLDGSGGGSGHVVTTRDHNERTRYGYGENAKDIGDEYVEFLPDPDSDPDYYGADENIGDYDYDDDDNRDQKRSGNNYNSTTDSEYTIEDFKRQYDEQFKDR